MPHFSDSKIKEKLGHGDIFALSIDTAVFDKYGCNLDFVVLNKLNQFKHCLTTLLFSEIVANEIKNHITRAAEETQRELKKAIRHQGNRWKTGVIAETLPETLALSADPTALAETQFTNYLAAVGGEVLPASGSLDVSTELLRRYFASEPPFEKNENKRYEFPDAFALLSLEAFAKEKNKLLLCVSPDKGWSDFASQSSYLICVPDLETVLSYFNDSGRSVADQVVEMWKNGTAPKLVEEVDHAFEYCLDDLDFYADGSSPFDFEAEPTSAVMQYVKLETASAPIVIATDQDSVTFTITVRALVAFEAEFSFYVKDGIDKDYVPLGSEVHAVEDDAEFHIAITVSRNIKTEPDIIDVEVTKRRIGVDFGYVQPFENEDPTFEKY